MSKRTEPTGLVGAYVYVVVAWRTASEGDGNGTAMTPILLTLAMVLRCVPFRTTWMVLLQHSRSVWECMRRVGLFRFFCRICFVRGWSRVKEVLKMALAADQPRRVHPQEHRREKTRSGSTNREIQKFPSPVPVNQRTDSRKWISFCVDSTRNVHFKT